MSVENGIKSAALIKEIEQFLADKRNQPYTYDKELELKALIARMGIFDTHFWYIDQKDVLVYISHIARVILPIAAPTQFSTGLIELMMQRIYHSIFPYGDYSEHYATPFDILMRSADRPNRVLQVKNFNTWHGVEKFVKQLIEEGKTLDMYELHVDGKPFGTFYSGERWSHLPYFVSCAGTYIHGYHNLHDSTDWHATKIHANGGVIKYGSW